MSPDFAEHHTRVSTSIGTLTLLAIISFSLIALSLSVSATADELAKSGETAHAWKFQGLLGERTIELSVGWTACKADLSPKFRKSVTEGRGRATITIFEEAREVPPGTHCFRSRGIRRLRVRFGQQVEKIKIYDGSSSPPALRFRGRRSGP